MRNYFLVFGAFILAGALALHGCSSSGTSGGGYSAETVLASPFVSTSGSASVLANKAFYANDRASRQTEISNLLSATSADSCSFVIDLSLEASVHAACYSPNLNYYDHPQYTGTPPNPPEDGQLPVGDLGLWNSTTTATSTEACTAGEINSLVNNFGKHAHTANLVGAALYCFVNNTADIGLPGAGETKTLTADQLTDFGFGTNPDSDTFTVKSASVTGADSSGNILRTYTVEGTLFDKESSKTFTIRVVNKHVDTGTNTFKALISYEFTDTNDALNRAGCDNTAGTTFGGHLIINKNSASELVEEFQSGEFCGGTTPVDRTTLLVSTAGLDGDTTNGWGNNFNYALFSFDPRSSEDTYLVGSYVYAWTAGAGDSNSRVFNVSISSDGTSKTGTGVFGYGKKPEEAGADFGKIQGMICNWAGPGNNHTPNNFVQRQSMTYNATTKLWEVGANNNIEYAPVYSAIAADDCEFTDDDFYYVAVPSGTTAGDDSNAYNFTNNRAAASATDFEHNLFDISSLKNSDGFYIPFTAFPTRPTL